MKTRLRIKTLFLFILLIIVGCTSQKEPTSKDEINFNTLYGYSPINPVNIWAPTNDERKKKIEVYLKQLRSSNGQKLEIISKSLVINPNWIKPKIKIYNFFTGELINKKTGEYLEMYSLIESNGHDTLYIYIDRLKNKTPRAPLGLALQ